MKDKYSRVKEMIKESTRNGKTDNNSYYIGFIHGVEESGEDATELRKLASKVPCLDHLAMGIA